MLCLGVRSVEITVVTFCLWCSKTWRRSMSRILKVPNTEPTRNWRETIVQVSDGLETAISLWRNDQMWVSSLADATCDLPRLIWGLEQPVEAKQDSWHVWTTELNSYLVLVSMSAWFQPRENLLYQSQWNQTNRGSHQNLACVLHSEMLSLFKKWLLPVHYSVLNANSILVRSEEAFLY